MEELLQNAGLSQPQAACYLYLLKHGATSPPQLATATHLTRSNAYKVLDTLEEVGLVRRDQTIKKVRYEAADPIALASLVAEQRNRAIKLEQGVKAALQELRTTYQRSSSKVSANVQYGTEAMVSAYEVQAAHGKPIYFIKSRADIPFLGYEVMDRLRRIPYKQYGTLRYGITPNAPEVPDSTVDHAAGLTRTIVAIEDYTAPVEWSVSGDELIITIFDGEGRTITIRDALVAQSFEQVWRLAAEERR